MLTQLDFYNYMTRPWRNAILIKQNVYFSVEELIYNINGDESAIRNYEEKKDSEIHVHTNIQEHKKVQNFRKGQNFLKTTCNQGL